MAGDFRPVAVPMPAPNRIDFFAGCALSGLLAGYPPPDSKVGATQDWPGVCSQAWDIAGMMMEET